MTSLRAAHPLQLALEVAVLAGHAGVDDRDRVGVLDEVAVDEAVAEAMQAGCELHGRVLLVRRSAVVAGGCGERVAGAWTDGAQGDGIQDDDEASPTPTRGFRR